MHRFQSTASTQSLADAVAEYYAAYPGLKRGTSLSPEAQAFFRCHDIVHVLYGCGTSMSDEAVVKLASIFGTTAGLSVLHGYALHESIDIYRKLPFWGTVAPLAWAPYLAARTIWRCSRQPKKWPWSENEQYASASLRELRAEFGVQVAHASAASAA